MSEEVIEKMEVKDSDNKSEKNESGMSKSKAKREARKAEAKALKKKKALGTIVETVVGVLIAGVFIVAIVLGIYQSATTVQPKNTYSECLTEEGYIKGADLSTVKDLGFESMVIPKSEVEYTMDEVMVQIDNARASVKEDSTDASLEVKDGDTIKLDYAGSVDGEYFDGGTDTDYSLVIGSGSFIDDFEQQLIGAHPGDEVTVNVTFPEVYENSPDLAGKDAVFECTVKAISVMPEFNDEFVEKYYAGVASTTEELKEVMLEQGYTKNLEDYITTYLSDNAEVGKYPKDYLKNEASVLYYSDMQNYEYYINYYTQMLGYSPFEKFSDYTGMTDKEYQAHLKENAMTDCRITMTYESIFRNNNLVVTDEMRAQAASVLGSNPEETYGERYVTSFCMRIAVLEYLKSVVTVQ